MPFTCTKETRLRVLQWKVLHNIYPTTILLHKMGIANSDDCKVCKEKDFAEHFFFFCKSVTPLWQEVEKICSIFAKKSIRLGAGDVMGGYYNNSGIKREDYMKINHIILVGKMVISKFKYGKQRNIKDLLLEELSYRGLCDNS